MKELIIKGVKRNQIMRVNKINNEKYASKIRLTGIDGKQIGIVTIKEALKKSKELGVNLVEISPNSKPPVCRLMDYGKFLYKKNKSLKKQKQKQKIIHIKEIKFRPVTDKSDYKIKLKNLTKFLDCGNKVKVTLRFRGREMAHKKIGMEMLNRIRYDLNKIAIVESFPKRIEGRQIVMFLVSKKK